MLINRALWPGNGALPEGLRNEWICTLEASQTLHTTCYNRPMRLHDCAPRPAHLKWLLDSDPSIRWQVMRDLTGKPPTRLPPSGLASQPKAGEPNFLPSNLLPATGAGPG